MSRSTQSQREPIRSHSFTFKSGKYAGYSIGDLMMDDPGYLLWLHKNTDFELHADLIDELETSFEKAARNARLKFIENWGGENPGTDPEWYK